VIEVLTLIRKDYLAFGHLIFFQLLITLGMMSFGLFIDKRGTMTFIALILYPLIVPTIMLINDKKYFELCNAMPNSRKAFVFSKYVGGFAASFVMIMIGMIYGYLVTRYIIIDGVKFSQVFGLLGFSFILIPMVLVNSIIFPIFFKLSREKGSIALFVLFGFILIGLLVGLVFVEKGMQAANMQYSEQDIFPMLMQGLANYIARIGVNQFLFQLFAGTAGVLGISIMLSIWGFSNKDIGGE
jgi:cytochrome c oxidase subunit IV